MTHVWIVTTDDSIDNVYVFEREEDAKAFAATYGGPIGNGAYGSPMTGADAWVGEESIIGSEMAAEMIAERNEQNDEADES